MPAFTRLFDGVICEINYRADDDGITVTSVKDLHGTERLEAGVSREEATAEARARHEAVQALFDDA